MMQWLKTPFAILTMHIRVPVQIPAPRLPIQLPVVACSGKQQVDGSSTWAPATYLGDPGSCLQSVPTLAVADTWKVNYQISPLFLFFSTILPFI